MPDLVRKADGATLLSGIALPPGTEWKVVEDDQTTVDAVVVSTRWRALQEDVRAFAPTLARIYRGRRGKL